MIGSYILACLKNIFEKLSDKTKVVAVMRNAPKGYLKELLDYNGIEIFQGDLADYNFCQTLPRADYIIHSAGYAQPAKFMEDRINTLKLNTFSTFLLLEKLVTNGKFLFISSSEVYNGLTTPPFREDQIGTTNTDNPRSCYIEGKRCGEAICLSYKQKGVAAKIARLSLTYGPGTKPSDKRALNTFIEKALSGKIDLMDQGLAKRTYCYITDAVEVLWQILLNGKDDIYNVAGNSKTTIRELAMMIGSYLNVPVNFPGNTNHALAGSPENVFLDLSKTKNEFHKDSYVNLSEGLQKTIRWQKELYRSL